MTTRSCTIRILFFALLIVTCVAAKSQTPLTFGIQGDQFVLDGKPFQIISGEMHYARIPREYWRDRLKKARAMGLNTISTYVFWNAHEPRPGVYDFSGNLDAATFIRMAQEEGLYVILRPGPYSCAEWDLGGFPAWLLKDPNIVLRSTDPKFMAPAERWINRLGQELAPLQLARGGPILAVQVENEYGSFGHDKVYIGRIRDALRNAGFRDALLFTADGGDELAAGTLPDVHAAINFGPGDAKKEIPKLQKFRPGTPVFNSEYWDGWFDHWGEHHHATDAAQQAQEIDWMLSQGYSINLYMFHGGTSFGFMSGANWDHNEYQPDVTSYDYDSPVSESGALTKKFYAFREVIAKHRPGVTLPDPPAPLPVIAIPSFTVDGIAGLWDLGRGRELGEGSPSTVKRPRNMESFGQSYGYILYRTRLKTAVSGDLVLPALRSYARVYLNAKLVGTADRRKNQDRVNIHGNKDDDLDILVEGTGRINFSTQLRNERQGINGPVLLAGKELIGWQVWTLPMDDFSKIDFSGMEPSKGSVGPAFYEGHFDLQSLADTFLDTRGWGKGAVWINGHALGRFWNVGPQQTLYVPAPYLKQGRNEVIVFTLGGKSIRLRGLREPILDEMGTDNN
ncbi:MAG TPA: beta-galactosidase family protein [Candidatus Sulfotelmatobacter sp.]|nr:beta-galactosidase family protein [Candidatus Sulfotelmatobacter sp.]